MHLSSNISHWVCIFTGVVLIATGLVSHASRTATNGTGTADSTESDTYVGKRAVLIAIGLIAVVYGVSRVLG